MQRVPGEHTEAPCLAIKQKLAFTKHTWYKYFSFLGGLEIDMICWSQE
jgi:hypothetical protein